MTQSVMASERPRRKIELRSIDTTRVGKAMPDSSAAVDIDGDGDVEIISAMQDADGHPEVFLYQRNDAGEWARTTIGVVQSHKEEIEYVAVGRPFPREPRICIAASVQHKKDGLVVFRLREPGVSPFDGSNWEMGVAKEYAGQGLAFHDLTGDGVEELVYCTQAGNELGVLKVKEKGNPMAKSGWADHLIDSGNDRAWWWLDGKFYDLNDNGIKNDFFVSTRKYGGSDLGMWKVVQTKPNALSSYRIEKIYDGDSLQFDTGFFFSDDREREPDIVMVRKPDHHVYLMDGRHGYAVTGIPIDGSCWNVKIVPFLGQSDSRDAFVVAAAKSPSLIWSFRWRNGAYEVWPETGYAGDYGHPMDGTFTIADVDGDGEAECVVPDSSGSKRSKGLCYLKAVRGSAEEWETGPAARFPLGEE
ncbi:MAG: hypothetical protein ACQESR_21890 [Planctomycetota bacterium]